MWVVGGGRIGIEIPASGAGVVVAEAPANRVDALPAALGVLHMGTSQHVRREWLFEPGVSTGLLQPGVGTETAEAAPGGGVASTADEDRPVAAGARSTTDELTAHERGGVRVQDDRSLVAAGGDGGGDGGGGGGGARVPGELFAVEVCTIDR